MSRRADLDPVRASPELPGPGVRGRDGQTVAGESLAARYASLVKLPHTVFALPFALVGVIYASFEAPVTAGKLALVVLAFTAARFAAMGFNRIVDLRYDALNARTSARELPAGRLTARQAGVAVGVAGLSFVVFAGLLNPLCLVLSPLALAWVLGYSYTKRFTSLSHLWLGLALAIAPVGGYLAVTGAWSTPFWTLLVLTGAVATWVAGFDVFYSLQDLAFDSEHGLRSLAVLLGEGRSILVAKLFHYIALILLFVFGIATGFGPMFQIGVGAGALILLWEHSLVRPGDLRKLDTAFFTMNGVMSLLVLAGAAADRVL